MVDSSNNAEILPAAWIGPNDTLMPNWMFESFKKEYPEKAKEFEPLYRKPKGE
jgi:hypothetical protein